MGAPPARKGENMDTKHTAIEVTLSEADVIRMVQPNGPHTDVVISRRSHPGREMVCDSTLLTLDQAQVFMHTLTRLGFDTHAVIL